LVRNRVLTRASGLRRIGRGAAVFSRRKGKKPDAETLKQYSKGTSLSVVKISENTQLACTSWRTANTAYLSSARGRSDKGKTVTATHYIHRLFDKSARSSRIDSAKWVDLGVCSYANTHNDGLLAGSSHGSLPSRVSLKQQSSIDREPIHSGQNSIRQIQTLVL